MRKLILTMAAMAFVLVGVTSCSKGESNPDEGKTGTLVINFTLDDGSVTRAATSTAKPVTTWANVTSMMILFVDPVSNVVADARAITSPGSGNAQKTEMFQDVRANSSPGWDAYIVGNHPSTWNVGFVIGKNIDGPHLRITAPSSPTFSSSPFNAGGTGYDEVPEIFVAKQTEVRVVADGNSTHSTPFKLARAVSIIRVRINQAPAEAPANASIKFNDATNPAMFVVRRATVTYSMLGTYSYPIPPTTFPGTYFPTMPVTTNVFFKAENMQTVNPASGYENGTTLLSTPDNITLWNDYLIWSGGSKTVNANRFDIVLSGVTGDATYVPREGGSALAQGTRVYWDGAVEGHVGPNQILELIITLKTAGSTEVPVVGQYGDLNIAVDLLPWGDIIPVPMPM